MVSPHVTLLAKLLREVWHARAQLFAIAIVVSVGVMVLLIMTTARQSLVSAQQTFYDEHRFADVFVELTRAPQSLLTTVQELPGVAIAETRIRSAARIELDGFADPIQAQLVSLPEQQTQLLNTLHLRSGALPTNSRQIVVSEPFAQAQELQLYDPITAILNGRRTELEIVGIAISPEFIYQIGPADIMPDYQRYGVFWLREDALAAALDMDGAFNSLLIKLEAKADDATVKLRLDQLFERYGGRGEGVVAAGETILELGDLQELEVQVDLLSSAAVKVRPGMPARINQWGGQEVLRGIVRRINPAGFTRISALGIEEQRVSVFIEFTEPTPELGNDYRVNAEIIVEQAEQTLAVPITALFRQDQQWQVFVYYDGQIEQRAVKVGFQSGIYRQILQGLEPGMHVVNHPSSDLESGMNVQI